MSDGGQGAGRIARGSGLLALAGLVALLPLLLSLPVCAAVTAGSAGLETIPVEPARPAAVPTLPPLPAHVPAAHDPGWGDLLDDREDWPRVPLGIGWLGPVRPLPGLGTYWIEEVSLPYYEGPAKDLAGWIARGWRLSLNSGARPEPLSSTCFVETNYETASLVVHEIRDDGWFRLDVRPPCDGADAVWVHRSHLPVTVRLETWAERFQSGSISPLYFRNRQQRHALRASPAPEADRIAWIGEADTFEALEIEGDWMRVRLAQPSSYCKEPETWKGRHLEGWLRWRDPVQGPWVWYFTRGC